MNAKTLHTVDTFTHYIKRLSHEAFRENDGRLSARQFCQTLKGHKDLLFSLYGDDYIDYTGGYLLKQATGKVEKITPQMSLDMGDDFILPEYLTVTDDTGEIYRIEATISTFLEWEKHNQLIKQKADENYLRYQQLERSRLYMLSLVRGNRKAKISDAINALYRNRSVQKEALEPA